jgi:hypothetical protein
MEGERREPAMKDRRVCVQRNAVSRGRLLLLNAPHRTHARTHARADTCSRLVHTKHTAYIT